MIRGARVAIVTLAASRAFDAAARAGTAFEAARTAIVRRFVLTAARDAAIDRAVVGVGAIGVGTAATAAVLAAFLPAAAIGETALTVLTCRLDARAVDRALTIAWLLALHHALAAERCVAGFVVGALTRVSDVGTAGRRAKVDRTRDAIVAVRSRTTRAAGRALFIGGRAAAEPGPAQLRMLAAPVDARIARARILVVTLSVATALGATLPRTTAEALSTRAAHALIRLTNLGGARVTVVTVDVDLTGHFGAAIVSAGAVLGFAARRVVGRVRTGAGYARILGAGDLVVARAIVAAFAAHAATAHFARGTAWTKVAGSFT